MSTKKTKHYLIENDYLMSEWNWGKNNELGLSPERLTSGSGRKAWWKCSMCTFEWDSVIANRSKGIGCPQCSRKKRGKKLIETRIKKTGSLLETNSALVEQWNFERNSDLSPQDVSPNSNKIVWWKCANGHEWQAQISSRNHGSGCPHCANNMKKSHDLFLFETAKLHPNIRIVEKYQTAKLKVLCQCLVCGNEWRTKPNNLLQGQGCPKCARLKNAQKSALTHEEFIQRVYRTNPCIEVIGTYKTAHSKINVMCKNCLNKWTPQAWDLIQGAGCPNCSHTNTSYTERVIYEAFLLRLGEESVIHRNTDAIGKELDIFIPKYKFAIEYGAWYWHRSRTDNDKSKLLLCEENGIKLIIIYDNYDSLQPPETQNIITYNCDLSDTKNEEKLIELIELLFNAMGTEFTPFTKKEWEHITHNAYISSRRISTESFSARLLRHNPNITVIGEYTGANNKIDLKCNVCCNVWQATPGHLLSGRGCPVCARKTTAKKLKKAVIKCDLHGNFIDEYEDATTASIANKISVNQIRNACTGKTLSAAGYIWKYKK